MSVDTLRTIAVTGATGFIGRAALPALRRRFPQARIRVLVRPESAAAARAELAQLGAEPVEGDLRAAESLEPLVRGADALLHLASPAPKSDGPTLHEVNVRGSRALAKAAAHADVHRLVYLSAASVYGAPHRGNDWGEDAPTIPYHDYGRTKLGAESAVTASFLELPDAEPDASMILAPQPGGGAEGRTLLVLRSTVVYGPGSPYLSALLERLRQQPKLRTPPGDEWLNPIFLGDLVEILGRALEEPRPGALVVNVGGPERVLLEDLRDRVAKAAGIPRVRTVMPAWLASLRARWSTRSELPAARAVLLAKARGETFNGCVAIDRLNARWAPKLTALEAGLAASLR